ncbi:MULTISPECIES: hypothetical protein [Bacillus amyloliquefaciens group]|uniref:hypothetical protein n=1 Tax=Bacillus amyloliquefaciens group TaxID=1938374 RepID=UPI001F51B3FF|nr:MULTISPECIES: hypothetical protein [Bacillus amyloliquefaciens group]MEC5261352.1 hypothetical protein [Bacillus amyloliquefaciens]WJM63828.1 hypothetical protein QTN46_09540 [Bacillus amyloliquefaciens]
MDNGSGTKVNIHFNNGSLIEGFKVSSELTEPSTIYEQIMNHPESKKAVLIKFGFGQLSPIKVEKWFKSYNPPKYYEFRKVANHRKVTDLHTQAMTKDQRTHLLNLEEVFNDEKSRNALLKLAEQNTKRNKDGLTIIEKHDPWRG